MTAALPLPGHQLQLLQGGAEYFPALEAAIDASRVEVRLETYIFHFDVSGQRIARALERAAARGVRVFLLMDGVGTEPVPQGWQARFAQAGLQWRRFMPLGRWGMLQSRHWARLHRKLCVIDAAQAFCGGINIVDDRVDPHRGGLDAPRLDFAVAVQGPLVSDMRASMVQLWRRTVFAAHWGTWNLAQVRAAWRLDADLDGMEGPPRTGASQAALVLRDNLRHRAQIERMYRKAIARARSEILIANAYFLPGYKLRRALVHAVRRGVRVRLLLQGRYEYFMQFHAGKPMLLSLLDAGVEIHEYQAGFLHAKVAVIDNAWATVGSSNLDPLSLLLAHEANVVVQDPSFAQQLAQALTLAIAGHSTVLDLERLQRRPYRQRLLDWLAYAGMRLVLFFSGRRY